MKDYSVVKTEKDDLTVIVIYNAVELSEREAVAEAIQMLHESAS